MSIRILYGHSEFMKAWVKSKIAVMRESDFGPATALGVMDGDRIIGGAVYHDWQPQFQTIEISVAADNPRWAQRKILAELFAYPFCQLNIHRINFGCSADDKRSRRFAEGLGLTLEGIGKDAFGPGKNVACYRLLRSEWIKGKFCDRKELKYGQERR